MRRTLPMRIPNRTLQALCVLTLLNGMSLRAQPLATRFPGTNRCLGVEVAPCTISVSSLLVSPDEKVRVTWSTPYTGIVDLSSYDGNTGANRQTRCPFPSTGSFEAVPPQDRYAYTMFLRKTECGGAGESAAVVVRRTQAAAPTVGLSV